MKTISSFIIELSLLFCSSIGFCKQIKEDPKETSLSKSSQTSFTIMSSPDLYNLTNIWSQEFMKSHPSTRLTTVEFKNNQLLNEPANLYLLSGDGFQANHSSYWKMAVGRDAIVPVIHAKNPLIGNITHRGITIEELSQILTDPEKQNWATLTNGKENRKINLYIIKNESVEEYISHFIRQNTTIANATFVNTYQELLTALDKDFYAIGICKPVDLKDATANGFRRDIKLLPIDKNRNGRIDYFENIYSTMDAFTRGIWIGKYPKELCGNVYVYSASKPTDSGLLVFLKWMNSEGQQFLACNSFGELSSIEKNSNIESLVDPIYLIKQSDKPILARTWLLILLSFAVIAVILMGVVKYVKKLKNKIIEEDIDITFSFNEDSIVAPKGIHFDKTHTWAFMEKDGLVKIGIDDFLQHVTGSITRIHMKEPGENVRRGEKLFTLIRNGKQMIIYAPISGVIKEQNLNLLTDASMLNSAPYSEGWVYAIEPKNWLREIQFLFMATKYKEWLQDEFTRLKDFIAVSVSSNSAVFNHVILQDGGELTDNVLADLGPEVWEDFQSNFIDVSK